MTKIPPLRYGMTKPRLFKSVISVFSVSYPFP